jgi:hypothetical protein
MYSLQEEEMARLGLLLVTMAVLALCSAPAGAVLVAGDDFSYPDGPVDGSSQDGGTGWSGPWSSMDQMEIVGGRLEFTPFGYHPGDTTRTLATTVTGPLYFSYTLNADFDYRASAEIYLGSSSGGIEKFLFKIGKWDGNPFWDFSTQGDLAGDTPNIDFGGQPKPPHDGAHTYFIVGKVEFDVNVDGDDRLSFWLDPTYPTTPLDTLEMDSGISSIDKVRFSGWENSSEGDVAYFDDLLIGTAWEDVAPVPEPVSVALLAVGGVAMLCRRR